MARRIEECWPDHYVMAGEPTFSGEEYYKLAVVTRDGPILYSHSSAMLMWDQPFELTLERAQRWDTPDFEVFGIKFSAGRYPRNPDPSSRRAQADDVAALDYADRLWRFDRSQMSVRRSNPLAHWCDHDAYRLGLGLCGHCGVADAMIDALVTESRQIWFRCENCERSWQDPTDISSQAVLSGDELLRLELSLARSRRAYVVDVLDLIWVALDSELPPPVEKNGHYMRLRRALWSLRLPKPLPS